MILLILIIAVSLSRFCMRDTMRSTPPITRASIDDLAFAVENNLYELFRAMAGGLPGGELLETNGYHCHLTFPTNPMFKGTWRTRLASDRVDAAIDAVIDWFRERQSPYMFWWTGPQTQPQDLHVHLMRRGLISTAEQQKQLAHGLVQSAAGAPGMAADLHAMNDAAVGQVPAGFSIEAVDDLESLVDFKKVFVEVYGVPDWAGQAWIDATQAVGIGKTPWKMYLGRLHGEPVATNMLFNGAGVASVYAVGALEAVRGQGIGGAITLKPLLEARAMGYRYAVLFASEMGIHTYQRIGFQLTQARMNRYLWRNE